MPGPSTYWQCLLGLRALRFLGLDARRANLAPAELDDEQHRQGVDSGHGRGSAEQREDCQQSSQHDGGEDAGRDRLAQNVLGVAQDGARITAAEGQAEVVENEADEAHDNESENGH